MAEDAEAPLAAESLPMARGHAESLLPLIERVIARVEGGFEAIDRVAELLSSVGIPATLAELGLPADRLRWTAEQAFGAERLVANNPRPLDVDALEHIVRAAHAGDRSALRESAAMDLTSSAVAR